jgi:uncharacterized protein YdcH (DUF465 family)
MALSMNDQKIKEILVKQNEHFKHLNLEHQQFDQRLKELNSRKFKTERDWIELRNLKKHKLRIKDSMQKYIFEYRKNKTHW